MTVPTFEDELKRIISNIETHEELDIVSKLYKKRWYEIDHDKASVFKKGTLIKWYHKKKVNWGIVVKESKKKGRYVEAISTKGSDWKLGGSIIQKVTDPKRIQKMVEQLKTYIDFEIEMSKGGMG